MIDQHLADGAVADQHLSQAFRRIAEARCGALEDRLAGKRGQRRLFRRLPDHGIAADQRERRIPRPDGDREVEGGDDADDAERMPGFHHAVAGALGGDGQAVELARQADGEIADVDHLLHFAEAFGRDLAGFDRDQPAELGLVRRAVPRRAGAPVRRASAPAPGARPGRPRAPPRWPLPRRRPKRLQGGDLFARHRRCARSRSPPAASVSPSTPSLARSSAVSFAIVIVLFLRDLACRAGMRPATRVAGLRLEPVMCVRSGSSAMPGSASVDLLEAGAAFRRRSAPVRRSSPPGATQVQTACRNYIRAGRKASCMTAPLRPRRVEPASPSVAQRTRSRTGPASGRS